MFWKKKQIVAAPTEIKVPATKAEVPQQPKAEKPKVPKLPGPKAIPGLVGKHLIAKYKMDPDLVQILKAVVYEGPKVERMFNCRIFDKSEAEASEVQIKDYTSLDGHPELILYEGWLDEESKRVEEVNMGIVIAMLVGLVMLIFFILIVFLYPQWLVAGGKFAAKLTLAGAKYLAKVVRHDRRHPAGAAKQPPKTI